MGFRVEGVTEASLTSDCLLHACCSIHGGGELHPEGGGGLRWGDGGWRDGEAGLGHLSWEVGGGVATSDRRI